MSMEQRQHTQEETPASTETLVSLSQQSNAACEAGSNTNAREESITFTEADSLTALLQQEARSRRNEELASFVWAGACMAPMLWWATRPVTDVSSLTRNLSLCFVLMGILGAGMCIQLCRRSYRRKRSFANALAQSHDVKHVGPLIQALRVQNTPVRNLAKQVLIDLLPTLKASDAIRLGDAERSILLRVLAIPPTDLSYRDLRELFSRPAFQREMELRLVILKALEQVGGARELPTVERLSRGFTLPALSTGKVPLEIQAAAKECLPYLQVRADNQSAREQLLRGSSFHTLPNSVLLRPANTQTDARPEQLLRAVEPSS
jgi:hypothetical protein